MAHQGTGYVDGLHGLDWHFEGYKGTGKEKNFESELIIELYSLGAIPIAKVSHLISIQPSQSVHID